MYLSYQGASTRKFPTTPMLHSVCSSFGRSFPRKSNGVLAPIADSFINVFDQLDVKWLSVKLHDLHDVHSFIRPSLSTAFAS